MVAAHQRSRFSRPSAGHPTRSGTTDMGSAAATSTPGLVFAVAVEARAAGKPVGDGIERDAVTQEVIEAVYRSAERGSA